MAEYKKNDKNDTVGKLFVGGLDWSSTIESITAYFEKFGEISDVELKINPTDPNKHRGFAFVKFAAASSASAVLAQTEHSIDGRKVDAKSACPPGVKPEQRTKKIFVGGLQAETTEEAMLEYFSKFGAIRDNKITFTVDRGTGKKRGFCFIEFNDEGIVDVIVSEKFHTVAGRRLETKRAEDKRQAPRAHTVGGAYPAVHSTPLAGLYSGGLTSSGYQQPIIYVSPESLSAVYSALGMAGAGYPPALDAVYAVSQRDTTSRFGSHAGTAERRPTYGSRRATPY